MLVVRAGHTLHPREIPEDVEHYVPVAFEITNTNGEVDYIHRKHIMEYLKNYPIYYGKLVTYGNKEHYDTNARIAKVRVVLTDDISRYDWNLCTFSIEDIAREISLHRKVLMRDIKKLAGVVKWFSKNVKFDINKDLDKIFE